jgi:hypothetical protein
MTSIKKVKSIKKVIKRNNSSQTQIDESFNRLVRFCFLLSEAEAEINSNK